MKSICFVLILLFSLHSAQPVFAHGDEPRIEISADRLTPGSVLDIRGVDFEFEEQVTLTLVGPQVEIPFGTVIADTDGIFLLTITLPVDLSEGPYVIRGTTDDHTVESPPLTIWGTALSEGGGQGPRDEDDSLLAPMPTTAPVMQTPVALAEVPVQAALDQDPSSNFIWIAVGVGLALLAGLIIARKKS